MTACPICATDAPSLGQKVGKWSGRTFDIARCPSCGLTFVANPWTDFGAIYSDAYYEGKGPDPLVNYVHESDHPGQTIRQHEWKGIAKVVGDLVPLTPSTSWLDYGCGTGGLLSYVGDRNLATIEGFEEGWSEPRLRAKGLPVLSKDDLTARAGTFDVITAIEVVEHVPDPVAILKELATLLRPGGLLFVTTGNAQPHASKILEWPYLIPEIHISLFEPRTLAEAMSRAGLTPGPSGFRTGWDDIIRFKTLKNLRREEVSATERLLPWSVVTRALDRRLKISAHPVGWKPRLAAGGTETAPVDTLRRSA